MPKTIYRPEYTVLVELVRELRLNAGLTQTEVSEKLGITQPKLSDVERGSRRLDLVELRDLAVICGTSLPEVVTELEARLKKRRAPAPAKRR
ncbi:helix-turn-helix domain-containing protein [Stenotrophomonas rhizophila]|jgi:transcriptional regulator with XRE-family HTH domain|uniref:helix-turn-helix domain-containing protein n=1 Tax=Stenotrophomonas rhizophila TaxID=216778 RepID=UPI0011A3727E|nr:helix-turn-helix transcriptional regulator [Stenotrophomonas rhizophila]